MGKISFSATAFAVYMAAIGKGFSDGGELSVPTEFTSDVACVLESLEMLERIITEMAGYHEGLSSDATKTVAIARRLAETDQGIAADFGRNSSSSPSRQLIE